MTIPKISHKMRWAGGAVALVSALLVGLVVACGKEESPMMTYQQAADTVEQLISETVASLRPVPRLESHGGLGAVPCSGPNDNRDTGLVMVEHDYRLRDIDPSLNDEMFRQIREYWSEHGYRVIRESGSDVSDPHELVAEHPENGFNVRLIASRGVPSMGAQSKCVRDPER